MTVLKPNHCTLKNFKGWRGWSEKQALMNKPAVSSVERNLQPSKSVLMGTVCLRNMRMSAFSKGLFLNDTPFYK